MNYNIDIEIIRDGKRHNEKAIVGSGVLTLPVAADVLEGDHMIRILPNGHKQEMIAKEVTVFQSPFGGALDHTEVKFISAGNAAEQKQAPVVNNNYTADNMQVTAGDSYGTTMNISYSAERLELLLDGLLAILEENKVHIDNMEQEESGKQRFGKLLPALKEGGKKLADNGIRTVFDLALAVLCTQYGLQ